MPDQNQLNDIVAELLELPKDDVGEDSDLEDLGWDSLCSVTFIAIADERFHVRIDTSALGRCETPAELLRLFG